MDTSIGKVEPFVKSAKYFKQFMGRSVSKITV